MKKKKETFGEQIEREMNEDPKLKNLCYQEMLLLDIKEKILEKLKERKMSKKKLAKLVKCDAWELNLMLNGDISLSVRTLSSICLALGYKVYFDLEEVY